MNFKRIFTVSLLILSLSITTVFADTTNNEHVSEVNLSDISNHWARENIEYLVRRGAISGYPDGTFQPNKTISKAEFVAIAIRSAADEAMPEVGGHWAAGVFEYAKDNHIIGMNEMPQSEWNEPINRYEMTKVMVGVTENLLNEGKASTTGVEKIMADYSVVQQKQAYKYYVEQAFMKGLIAGKDSQGTFAGADNGTRAEAATMVTRILEVSKRVEVNVDKVEESETSGRQISLTDENRPLVPKAGDTVINADGQEVILETGPAGVLGENQGVNYYEGIKGGNGHVFEEGDTGTRSMGYLGSPYLVDKETGEGHFLSDWNLIRSYYYKQAQKIQNPKEGQTTTWYLYMYGQWYFTGPVGN